MGENDPADQPAPSDAARPLDKDTTKVFRKPSEAVREIAGREVTLQPFSRFPGGRPPKEILSGREATLSDSPLTGITGREITFTDTPATGISGREVTLSETPATSLTGREQTLSDTPATNLTGREATLGDTPVTGLTGREQTLGDTPATGLSGREATLGDTPATGLTGREQTLGETPATGIALGARLPGTAPQTPVTSPGKHRTPAGGTSTGKPRTGHGTSHTFDDAWHLDGRKGPYTGQTWNDFVLGGILGEGGMGAVYRGKQISLKRRVAIKVLPPNLAADQRLLQRFQLEAHTSSQLSSPHVVQVYSVGAFEGNHFYAMEYVEGTDLYDLMKAKRDAGQPIDVDGAVDFILQAAKGLAEAGRHGVVHRDIKPPNLMITKGGLLKITDFGIAKLVGEHNLTMTGQAVGTPAYISPEQGRGDAAIDQRSDLYSLGVVFYEIVAGEKPFKGTTPNALIYQHCYEEPDLPRKLNPAVTEEVQAIILRCLQKKPEHRYQSADELIHDLESIRTGSMLKSAIAHYRLGTGADEAKREQMNWWQRNLLPLSLAAVALVLAGGGGGWWWLDRRAKTEKAIEIAARTRESSERLAQEEIKNRLRPLLKTLDERASLPDQVDQLLKEFAERVKDGTNDREYLVWTRKVTEVRAAALKLAPLDKPGITFALRQQGRRDLESYTTLVGTADPAQNRWTRTLDGLDGEERTLRQSIGEEIDKGRLTQGSRDATAAALTSLRAIADPAEAKVVAWSAAITSFDQRIATLTALLAPLDDANRTISDRQRESYREAIAELRKLEAREPRLKAWADRLARAEGDIKRLRDGLESELSAAAVGEPALDRADELLPAYAALVAADDADLKRWKVKVEAVKAGLAAKRRLVAETVDQLGKDGRDAFLGVAQLEPLREKLREIKALARPGDQDLARWEDLCRRSAAEHVALARDLAVLDPSRPEPISLAQQTDLRAKQARLVRLGGVSVEQAETQVKRLDAEAARVAGLRTRLKPIFTAAHAILADARSDLDRLALDVGDADAEVEVWKTKRSRVDALRAQLAVLDQRKIPDQVETIFAQLVTLVGEGDPDVARWKTTVGRIRTVSAALAPLDRDGVPIPADAASQLSALTELVEATDPLLRRRQAKFDEVCGLRSRLAKLTSVRVLTDRTLAAEETALARLTTLIGPSEADVQGFARRLAQLAGPGQPPWASAHGRDGFGPWAEFQWSGESVRLRWIAPGSVTIGSPESEPGRDADEVQVVLSVSRGFWLADAECTQAVWQAATGREPSRFAGRQRPVERVSWDAAQTMLAAARARQGNLPLRLPSESEWELACRAGGSGRWPGEAEDPCADRIAWTSNNSGGATHEIRQRYPNAHGLYDLHGNVWELCQDAYAPYPTSASTDHLGKGGDLKVARGGSWGDPANAARAANRLAVRADLTSAYLGLRLAVDGPDPATLEPRQLASRSGGWSKPIALSLGPVRLTGELSLIQATSAPEAVRKP